MRKSTAKLAARGAPPVAKEMLSPSPDNGLPWTIAFALLLVLTATVLWWPISRIGVNDAINYNEGWNSYIQQTAANGGKIYGEAPLLSYTNYPPVSFYVVGLLSKATGNVTMTGRWVSLLSLLVVAALSAMTVQRISGYWRAGLYSGLAILVYVTVLKPDRIGMNDPHLLGMALGAAGLYCAVRDPESDAWLRGSAAAFALSLFTKQTLLAFPAAVAIYLFVHFRRRFAVWLIAAAAISGALLAFTFAVAGSHFLEHLGLPRTYTLSNVFAPLASYVLSCSPAIAVVAAWAVIQPTDPGSRLAIHAFGLSTVAGCVFVSGAGGEGNLLFDSVVALALCLGVLGAKLPGWAATTPRPAAFAAIVLTAPFVAAIFPVLAAAPANAAQAASAAQRQQEFERLVQFVQSQPGPALCESLLACFEAGKPKLYDAYVVSNLLSTGKLREAEVLALIEQRRFNVIQLDRPETNRPITIQGHSRFSPAFMTRLFTNYREGFSVSGYAAFVPR
jgi:hypothetical protein